MGTLQNWYRVTNETEQKTRKQRQCSRAIKKRGHSKKKKKKLKIAHAILNTPCNTQKSTLKYEGLNFQEQSFKFYEENIDASLTLK